MLNDFSLSSISVKLSFIRFWGPSTEVRIWWCRPLSGVIECARAYVYSISKPL